MAINKNFVIKNGIQVNDTLLVGNPLTNRVGVNTAIPEYDLQIVGGIGVTDARITGVTTALGDVLVANSSGEDGKAFAVRVSAGNSVGINTANPRYPLEVIGPAQSGTIAEYVFGDLEISGDINSANFSSGSASFSGITTFTNTTQNIIGSVETGAVQIRGGLGVSKNLSVGAGLSVAGNSYFVGVVTFAAGASGKIQLGDNANDNVEFQADVNSNIIPNVAGFDLGSSSQKWRELHLAGNAGIGSLAVTGISTFSNNVRITSLTNNRIPIVGAGSTIEDDANLTFDGNTLAVGTALTVTGISTFNSDVDINADVDVSGNIGVGSLAVTGISTFVGLSTFNNGIAVLSGVSTFLGNINADGNLDVDGHTDLDDLVVTGVSTYSADLDINADVDVSGNIGVGSLSVSGISTFSSDIDINADVDISGNIGVGSITVSGISTFVGLSTFNGGIAVLSGISTFNSDVDINADVDVSGNAGIGSLTVTGISTFVGLSTFNDGIAVLAGVSTFKGNINADGNLDVDGHTDLDDLVVTGVSTYSADLDINADVDVSGNAGIGSLDVVGVSTFGGIATFTNTTNNTLGDTSTGAVKIAGGLAVAKNLTVKENLRVGGYSYFVGVVTFAAGSSGTIQLGDNANDNIDFKADINSNIIPNADDTYDLGSSSQQWKNLYVNGLADLDYVNVSLASTFGSDLDINADVDVSGNAGIGSLAVTGISTFVGLSTFNNGLIVHSGISTFESRIVGAAVSNVIPFYYNNVSDFPSAATYHGAFGHAHNTGKAYFAHGGVWLELVNANSASVVGTGTEGYNVGVVTATELDLGTGGLDVDGHTELDGVNVSGATTTNILHVGTSGTVLTVSDQTSEFKIGSASNPVTATMNGGAIPSIGLVIALGG